MNLFPQQQNPFDFAQLAQLNQLNQVNLMQPKQTILDEITKLIEALNEDEKVKLFTLEQFKEAHSLYTQGLNQYILDKFAQEYVQTQVGQDTANNLKNVINNLTGSVKQQTKAERDKLLELQRLLEQNPDLINKLRNEDNRNA